MNFLKYFKGRNFRNFAVFIQIRENLFPQNFSKDVIRETAKFSNCSYNLQLILTKEWMFGVNYTLYFLWLCSSRIYIIFLVPANNDGKRKTKKLPKVITIDDLSEMLCKCFSLD